MEHAALSHREVLGTATVRRIGGWSFPVYELIQNDEVLARMGRFSWFGIYFGSGQQIELASGDRWRIASVGAAGNICPRVVDSTRRKVAVSALGAGSYFINGRDYRYVLYPADPRWFGRSNGWILREHEEDLAVVTPLPMTIRATSPVPLGAVLLSFVLARYGIPGELAPTTPPMNWT